MQKMVLYFIPFQKPFIDYFDLNSSEHWQNMTFILILCIPVKNIHNFNISFINPYLFLMREIQFPYDLLYLMHPQRFRQRIERADKINALRTQMNGGFVMDNINGQSLETSPMKTSANLNGDWQKLIYEMTEKFVNSLRQQRKRPIFSQEMEIRDHYIILQTPILEQQKQKRQKQIKIWLGEVCRQVFSISFNYFSHKILDTQTTKAFSSQCFLGNLISLSKVNRLTEQDFQLINLHLKNQILPYFLLRYPQSSSKQVNQKLNKQVSATDYLDTNQNNIFMKSKIKLQYRQNGIYYDIIMKFINYIIDIPQKLLQNNKYVTYYDDFNEKMEKLFTSVYNRKWAQTNLYDNYTNSNESVETLREKVHELQQELNQNLITKLLVGSAIKPNNNTSNINSDKDYEEAVKQYTHYLIGRKVSQNVPKYSNEEIRHGNIKILSPSILRIIVKWCSELEEKFQNDYFLERNEPFVMINGEEAQMTDEYREKLCRYAQKQWEDIKKFLKNIQYDIYEKQAQLSHRNLMYYSTQKLPQYEEGVIKFANRNTEDVNHYAVCYLNRLIHGLMRISNHIHYHLNGWAQWPFPPIFITFTISDLLRCKCVSKEKQIIRIYKELQIQSVINPQLLRIVKVKNRLNKGTKDILLNILFHQTTLCEIQLSIKVDQSDFSLWSDKFNHYIYELQRSTYGPVTEMSSIWASIDQRSSLLKSQKIRVQQFDHSCSSKDNIIQILPFTCSMCYTHYSQSRYIYDHYRCSKCQKFWTCALCRISTVDEQSLVNQIKEKTKNVSITRRISEVTPQFPQYFVGFQLESLQAVGQRFRRFQASNTIYFASYSHNSLIVKQMKKSDKNARLKLFDRFIFFETTTIDPELAKLNLQQVIDETTLNQISQCYKKRSEALRIPRKNINTELLLKINDFRAQINITTMIFPQNNIDSIKQLGLKFPSVKMLNLNKNKITSLQGISNMKKLTDLYLGQNRFKQIVELENLIDLRYLQLGDNPNAPQFKCNLSNLVNLQSVTLIRSNLPTFPSEICNLSNLKLLWLFENRITEIPSTISRLKNLQYLSLEMNQITKLPQQLYQLRNLIKLMLGFNKIQEISRRISQLTKLQLLSLEGNTLIKIPVDEIVGLHSMQMLSMDKEYEAKFQGKMQKFLKFT